MANVFDITAGALSAKLITYQPDWASGVRIQHRWASRVDDSESGKERRSPDRASMSLTIAYDLLMTESEAEELRNLIGGLDEGYLLAVPLWPDAWPVAEFEANRRYEAQYLANFDEGVGGSVHTAVPGSPVYAGMAPLMFGKLLVEPRFKAINETKGRVRMTIEDDSAWSHRVEVKNFAPGSVWPVQLVPGWTSDIVEVSKNKIRRSQVGDLREKQFDGQEWVYRYERGASFQLDSDDIGTLLDFWHIKKGRATSFDAPAWFAPGTATAEAPHGAKSRFDSENLDITFQTRIAAATKLRLVTLPWETAGSAAYEMPQKARFFKFEYMSPTPVVTRYTSHEASLTTLDGTWTPAPFEMQGSNARDLKLTHRPFKIRSHEFAGNPLLLFLPYDPDARLMVTVSEAPLGDLENSEILHVGRIDQVESKSRELYATGSLFGGVLDSPFPRFRVGHLCNWNWGSNPCGVNKASYLETGTIASITDTSITVTTTATDDDDAFAKGLLEISDGLTFERRSIIRSTKGAGTQVLDVDRPLRINGVAAAVNFWPGCDQRYTGGCLRYGNQDRFGNAPFIPEKNLATDQPTEDYGGKK